jgi:hypothetical protein
MRKSTVFRRALDKAVKNGYLAEQIAHLRNKRIGLEGILNQPFLKVNVELADPEWHINKQDYAKALFGEEELEVDMRWDGQQEPNIKVMKSWEYHLTMLILSDNRAKYLEKFI